MVEELNENMKSIIIGVMSMISQRTLCYVLWQELKAALGDALLSSWKSYAVLVCFSHKAGKRSTAAKPQKQ